MKSTAWIDTLQALLLIVCLLLTVFVTGLESFAVDEPFVPQPPSKETAFYRSYPYGNFLADAARQAGNTDIAVIPNADVERALRTEEIPLARAELSESQFNSLLEEELNCVAVDGEQETIISTGKELGPFWQIAGFRLTYDPTAEAGDHVVSVQTEEGASWFHWPVTVTAPVSVLSAAGITVDLLDVTLDEAATRFQAHDDSDVDDARIRPLGIVENSIVHLFPRWMVILLPLLAAFLFLIARGQGSKYKDAYGLFLDRKGRNRI